MTALLDSLSTGQLSTVYAELTGSMPVRFNTKTNGRKRVETALKRSGRNLAEAMRSAGMPGAPAEQLEPDDTADQREAAAATEMPDAPKPRKGNGKAGRKPSAKEENGIALTSMVVAPAGKGLKVYAYGYRTKGDGSTGSEARLSVDGQPKGGFHDMGAAVEWTRQRFGSFDAAKDWARNEASKGTRLNDPHYAGWTKTLAGEVAF